MRIHSRRREATMSVRLTQHLQLHIDLDSMIVVARFFQMIKAEVFDITKFGAKPDADISKALTEAWKAACASRQPSKVVIPKGRFPLNVVEFKGPCEAPIEVQIDGEVIGPEDPVTIPAGVQWITFSYIVGLTVSGSGTLDGVGGAMAWATDDPATTVSKGSELQYNLSFNFIKDSLITGITSKDSKNFHADLMTCDNVTFDNFHVSAPPASPNTDGIHIGWSKNITVKNSVMETGADCVSVGDGCQNVLIEGVKCGPGHGISVGSLGKKTGEKPVIAVSVKNCTFSGSENGVRIETWLDSHAGEVSDMIFEDLIMDKVKNPILIDQDYCPFNKCNKEKPSLVKVHNIFIKNVKGSSSSPEVVKLICSKADNGCENVHLTDINLTYEGPSGAAVQECQHVKPIYSGEMIPPGCTGAADA